MTQKTRVLTADAPPPAHVFSQGVRKGPIVQVSGQGPWIRRRARTCTPGDVAAQTVRTLENVRAIVEAAGAAFDDIVMLRVYLTKREDFAAMNEPTARSSRRTPPRAACCPPAPRSSRAFPPARRCSSRSTRSP